MLICSEEGNCNRYSNEVCRVCSEVAGEVGSSSGKRTVSHDVTYLLGLVLLMLVVLIVAVVGLA